MKSLKNIIKDFLTGKQDGVATVQEIYSAVDSSDYQSKSIDLNACCRRALYSEKDTFVRVCRGVYMLNGEKTSSLLINGDGRKLNEIEKDSIDCIITDHPWSDTKANKGGNRNFVDYETFKYTKADFIQKARVLKEGAYLVEFLPVESATNYDYLYEIKKMAEESGLMYYTHCIWRNSPERTKNTGRTCKGVQQIVIFSKGKPRKLSADNVCGYQTKDILPYEIEMLINSQKRVHKAEKPVALYEFLIQMFTEEKDICLDQFGGSCNMVKAALNTNRFAICYEIAKDFVENAVERFAMIPLYKNGTGNDNVKEEYKQLSFAF